RPYGLSREPLVRVLHPDSVSPGACDMAPPVRALPLSIWFQAAGSRGGSHAQLDLSYAVAVREHAAIMAIPLALKNFGGIVLSLEFQESRELGIGGDHLPRLGPAVIREIVTPAVGKPTI